MKASPFIGLGVIACIFGGIYFVMKGIMVDAEQLFQEAVVVHESSNAEKPDHDSHDHDSHDHDSHDHDSHDENTGHNDTQLSTQITLYFSSLPESLKVQQGDNILIDQTNPRGLTYSDLVTTSIEGHIAELLVEVIWKNPNEQNFLEIELAPENHEQKTANLRSDGNIQDIAVFQW